MNHSLKALGTALIAAVPAACSSTPAEEDPLAALEDGEAVAEPYSPPPSRPMLSAGDVIFECELHLRAWQEAYSNQRDPENRQVIESTERSLAMLVRREKRELENQAQSGPPRNRGIASAALGFGADPSVLPVIMNNVGSDNDSVQANALLGVAALASEDTPLGPLQEIVWDPDVSEATVQNAAFAAFRLAGQLRRDPEGGLSAMLIPLLERPEADVRAQAVAALGMIDAAHAIPMIARMAKNDPQPIVRTAAAYALGEIGSPGSGETLVKLLDDPDPLTAGTARGSLTKIFGEDLGPDPDDWQRVLKR